MRNLDVELSAVAAAAAVLAGVGMSPVAHASTYGPELNGTYTVTSNGDWAKTNDVYIDEATVRSTWTISSTCSGPTSCTGQVTSDQGWTAPLRFTEDRWLLDRVIDNWEPCPNGTAAPGYQKYMFWGVDADGQMDPHSNVLAGTDVTHGDSGACGINKPLVIRLPLRVQKVS
jgi:hypothetical protein